MIFLFDIHSTIFDEHQEYMFALKAAIESFISDASTQLPVTETTEAFYNAVYSDLQKAHIALQSDWDNRAFDQQYMPTLRALFSDDTSYETAKQKAIAIRRNTSKKCIKENTYPGVVDLIKQLKTEGHFVYLCTDANIHCLSDILEALALSNIIDGCYGCASANLNDTENTNNKIKALPIGVFKPNTRIIAEIILDHARNFCGKIATFEQSFELNTTNNFNINNLNEMIYTHLITKDPLLHALLQETVIIGDSWRDIVLGENAGILKIEAAYGQKEPLAFKILSTDSQNTKSQKQNKIDAYQAIKKESLDTVDKVTYWIATKDSQNRIVDRLHLLDKRDKALILNCVKPDIICQDSIDEIGRMAQMHSIAEVREKLQQTNIKQQISEHMNFSMFKVPINIESKTAASSPLPSPPLSGGEGVKILHSLSSTQWRRGLG